MVEISVEPVVGSTCPRAVSGISAWPLFSGVYALGNRSLDSYVVIPEAKLQIAEEIVSKLDGSRSLASIAKEYLARGQAVDVAGLHARLTDAGLVVGSQRTGELRRLGVQLLDIPVAFLFKPGIRVISGAFIPLVVITGILMLAGVFAAASLPVHIVSLAMGRIVFPPVLLYSIAAFAYVGTILWHELFHALAAIRYGLVPSRLSIVGYLVVIPMFLLRIPGIYLIEPPKRIRVWAAGMWGSLTFAALAALTLRFATISLPWQQLLARLALANVFVALFNLIPFLPTDGYFILSTLLRQANIRQRAWRELKEVVRLRRRANGFLLVYMLMSGALMAFLLSRSVLRMYWLAHHSTAGFAVMALLITLGLLLKRFKASGSGTQQMGGQ